VHNSLAVLIIADDAAFPRDLVSRWQGERTVPGVTVLSTELFPGAASGNFDLAIVGPVRPERLTPVLRTLEAGTHPVICVLERARAHQAQVVKTDYPRLLVMQQHDTWLDSVLMLATECLRRVELTARLRRAERAGVAGSRAATLGRYMLENQHDFSNLLTSVLGNSELLLTDSEMLPELARDQVQTIHATALRMHQVMQRFSSLAIEMQMAEKQSQDETPKLSHMTATAN
jgi:signal transduction histidine kinase